MTTARLQQSLKESPNLSFIPVGDEQHPVTKFFDFSDDQALIKDNIVRDSKFVKVNLSKLNRRPVKPSDIKQVGIGNCYLLVGLGSALRRNPNLLNPNSNKSIIQNNKDGTVTVFFYDAKNPSIRYGYKINATKVVTKGLFNFNMNFHNHDIIYLIEKAYALHRMMNEKDLYTPEAMQLLDLYEKNFGKKTSQSKKIDETALKDTAKEVPINIKLDPKVTKEAALEKFITTHQNNYQDYNTALTGGLVKNVHTSLLGVPTEAQEIEEESAAQTRERAGTILSSLLPNIKIDKVETQFLIDVFGAVDNDQAKHFLSLAETALPGGGFTIATDMLDNKNFDVNAGLKQFFRTIVGDEHSEKNKSILKTLDKYVDNKFTIHKRGSGIYTSQQTELYEQIKKRLQMKQLISLATREKIASKEVGHARLTNESKAKGLAGGHVYEVINAYERDGKKFILLHNPWNWYGRDYEYKTKKIHGKQTEVLSAKANYQIKTFGIFSSIKSLMSRVIGRKFSPRDAYRAKETAITNPALPIKPSDKFNRDGFFELELTDVTKRCDRMYTTNDSSKMDAVLYLLNIALENAPGTPIQKSILDSITNLITLKTESSQTERRLWIQALAISYLLLGLKNKADESLKRLGKEPNTETYAVALNEVKQALSSKLPKLNSLSLDKNCQLTRIDLGGMQSTYLPVSEAAEQKSESNIPTSSQPKRL